MESVWKTCLKGFARFRLLSALLRLPYASRLQVGATHRLSPNLMTAVRLRIVFPVARGTTTATFWRTLTDAIFGGPRPRSGVRLAAPVPATVDPQFSVFQWVGRRRLVERQGKASNPQSV